MEADGRSDILATSKVQTTALTAYYHSSVTLAEVIIVGGDGKSVAHVPDLNGDGLDDLALGGVGIANSGRVTVHLVGCSQPIQYCNGKTNSLGCTPSIEAVGSPSVSVADNLVLVAKSVLNNKPGLLIWSPSWAFLPFGGGTLCVGSPLKRTPAQTSGGNSLPIQDCSGNYGFHFSHSYALANGLGPGQEFYAQYWSRDQGFTPPNNIGLTDAVCVALFP